MKIIKQGKVPDTLSEIWRGVCKTCGTIAEAKRGELGMFYVTHCGNKYTWAKCPVCNTGPLQGLLFDQREQGES